METDEGHPLDEISVLQIHTGDGDGADIVFEFNGQLIAVSIFPSSAIQDQKRRSINDHLISLLGRSVSDEIEDGDYEEIVDEVLGIILDTGRPLFKQASPLVTPIPSGVGRDLESFLSPRRLNFQVLETASGTTMVVPIGPDEAYTSPVCEAVYDNSDEDELDIDSNLPRHSTKNIIVAETFLKGIGRIVCRVWVEGEEMFCKARGGGRGLIGSDVGRELASLHSIHNCPPNPVAPMRIPKLLGNVIHADTGHVVGFLRQWVPGSRLSDADIPATSAERRRKWASQIRGTVDRLHEIGVIWGNGKTSNIIIDDSDDAWLIDFGGGFTNGWVDEELAETVEGDEQAIRNIVGFLEVNDDI